VRYTRVTRGKTQKELAEDLGISRSRIALLETNSRPTSPKLQQDLTAALGLTPEDPLYTILDTKRDGTEPVISNEAYQSLVAGKVVFHDPSLRQEIPPISPIEQEIINKRGDLTFGQMLKSIRTNKLGDDVSKRELASRTGTSINEVNLIENEKRKPDGLIVVRIAGALGYDLHHPITQSLLEKLRSQSK